MELRVGTRLKSAACATEVIVVKGSGERQLTCGGLPMLRMSDERSAGAAPVAGEDGGTAIGKRYVDAEGQLELLCTKAGAGSLADDGEPLTMKAATQLPPAD